MPAQSKAQQKFMGAVYALKKGDIKPSDASPEVRKVAKDMKKSDAKDFASTKHKNLPNRVRKEIIKRLKAEGKEAGPMVGTYALPSKMKKRKHSDTNNLGKRNKDGNSGQPDLEERLYVPSKFDKALDRLKFNQFTPNNIKKLSKKFKVDYKDAVEFIKQNKVINVANKPTMAEGSSFQRNNSRKPPAPYGGLNHHILNKSSVRKHDDDANFPKKDSGQEDLDEAKVETERFFGKKGIIIMIRDGNKMVSAIFKDKKNADKFNRNNPSDVKKLLQLAKKTKFPKAIDEKTYGISDDNPVQFEAKYNYKADALTAYFKGKIDAKELDSIARNQFKSGIATKKELSNFLSNKFTQDVMSDTYGIPAGTLVKRVRGLMKFAEGMNEDKKQVKDLVKKVKFEKIFYDVLSTMEKKFGKRKYRMWLEKSLKDFGENPKHYDYRTNAAIEEKLFQLGK